MLVGSQIGEVYWNLGFGRGFVRRLYLAARAIGWMEFLCLGKSISWGGGTDC